MRPPISVQPMQAGDCPALMALWQAAEGVRLRPTDTPEALARLLGRNPACNFSAYAGTQLVGSVLAGHDGWRGYLYHLAVAPDYRNQGVATQLVGAALAALGEEGIPKIHCLVERDNRVAQQFWTACGFVLRNEVLDYSRSQPGCREY